MPVLYKIRPATTAQLRLLFHAVCVYRLKVAAAAVRPKTPPALIFCNLLAVVVTILFGPYYKGHVHVLFIDFSLLMRVLQKPITYSRVVGTHYLGRQIGRVQMYVK